MKTKKLILALSLIGLIGVYSFSTSWKGIEKYLKNVSNVTQTSSITTAVNINGRHGTITTVSSTIATDANASFVVNVNDSVDSYNSSSKIFLTAKYAGTSGVPYPIISAQTDSTFTIKIFGLVDTLNAVIRINYSIEN